MAHQKLGMSGYCSRRSNESEHSTDPLIRPILNPLYQLYIVISCYITIFQWIGWREKLQDTPRFDGQNSMGLRFWFSLQSNEFLEFQYWYGGSPVKNGGFSSEISIFPPFFPAFLEPTPPWKPWGQDDLPPTAEVPSTSMASSGNLTLHGVLFQRVFEGFHRLVKDTVYIYIISDIC